MDFQQFKQFLLNLNLENFLLFFVINIFLSGAWLFLCLYLDRQAPEPRKEILKAFFWGGFIVFPVLLIAGPISTFIHEMSNLNSVIRILFLSFMIDGLIEEWAKFSVLSEKFYLSRHFDEPRDGIIYGMVIGLGFSFVENFLYSLTFTNVSEGLWIIILRGLATTFMHILAIGTVGYYLGMAKFASSRENNKNRLIWQGLIIAILLHGLFNTVIRFGYEWALVPLAILLIGVYIVILSGLHKMSHLKLNTK